LRLLTVGTLTLTNITNIGTFNVRPDGNGGTLLVDPPADNTAANAPQAQADSHVALGDQFHFAGDQLTQSGSAAVAPVSFVGDQFNSNVMTQQDAFVTVRDFDPSYQARAAGQENENAAVFDQAHLNHALWHDYSVAGG
jgi:hypothetical protein